MKGLLSLIQSGIYNYLKSFNLNIFHEDQNLTFLTFFRLLTYMTLNDLVCFLEAYVMIPFFGLIFLFFYLMKMKTGLR